MRIIRIVQGFIGLLVLTSISASRASAVSADPASTLSIEVGERSVAVRGLSPGGTAIVLGVQREPLAGGSRVATWARSVRDDNGDGAATFDLDRVTVRKASWAAFDLANGNRATSGARGFEPRIAEPGGEALELEPGTGEPTLRLDSGVLQAMVVRVGAGAWTTRAYDGGRGDSDGLPDGVIRLPLRETAPLLAEYGDYPGLAESDLICAIDEQNLTIYFVRGADAPASGR